MRDSCCAPSLYNFGVILSGASQFESEKELMVSKISEELVGLRQKEPLGLSSFVK